MKRTQIYITEEQDQQLAALARDRRISKAQVIREILDAGLHPAEDAVQADAIIEMTAGICADYPDWETWQREMRGRTADERLDALGL